MGDSCRGQTQHVLSSMSEVLRTDPPGLEHLVPPSQRAFALKHGLVARVSFRNQLRPEPCTQCGELRPWGWFSGPRHRWRSEVLDTWQQHWCIKCRDAKDEEWLHAQTRVRREARLRRILWVKQRFEETRTRAIYCLAMLRLYKEKHYPRYRYWFQRYRRARADYRSWAATHFELISQTKIRDFGPVGPRHGKRGEHHWRNCRHVYNKNREAARRVVLGNLAAKHGDRNDESQ